MKRGLTEPKNYTAMALVPCPNCGKPISPNAVNCPHCGMPVPPAEKEIKCPECGTQFPATNEVCPNCGEPNKAAQTMSLTGDKEVWPKLMFVPAVLAALGMLFALAVALAGPYYYHVYKNFVVVPFLVFFLYNILFSPKGSKLFIFSLVGAGLAATGMLAALVGWNVVVDLFYAGVSVMMLLLPLVGKAKRLATICSAVMLGGWTLLLILYACRVVYIGMGVVYAMIIAPATLALFLLLYFLSRKGCIF